MHPLGEAKRAGSVSPAAWIESVKSRSRKRWSRSSSAWWEKTPVDWHQRSMRGYEWRGRLRRLGFVNWLKETLGIDKGSTWR